MIMRKNYQTFSEVVKKSKESELLDKEKRLQEFGTECIFHLQKEIRNLFNPSWIKYLKQ